MWNNHLLTRKKGCEFRSPFFVPSDAIPVEGMASLLVIARHGAAIVVQIDLDLCSSAHDGSGYPTGPEVRGAEE